LAWPIAIIDTRKYLPAVIITLPAHGGRWIVRTSAVGLTLWISIFVCLRRSSNSGGWFGIRSIVG